jgi:hypothetical protein
LDNIVTFLHVLLLPRLNFFYPLLHHMLTFCGIAAAYWSLSSFLKRSFYTNTQICTPHLSLTFVFDRLNRLAPCTAIKRYKA